MQPETVGTEVEALAYEEVSIEDLGTGKVTKQIKPVNTDAWLWEQSVEHREGHEHDLWVVREPNGAGSITIDMGKGQLEFQPKEAPWDNPMLLAERYNKLVEFFKSESGYKVLFQPNVLALVLPYYLDLRDWLSTKPRCKAVMKALEMEVRKLRIPNLDPEGALRNTCNNATQMHVDGLGCNPFTSDTAAQFLDHCGHVGREFTASEGVGEPHRSRSAWGGWLRRERDSSPVPYDDSFGYTRCANAVPRIIRPDKSEGYHPDFSCFDKRGDVDDPLQRGMYYADNRATGGNTRQECRSEVLRNMGSMNPDKFEVFLPKFIRFVDTFVAGGCQAELISRDRWFELR